MTTFAIVHGAWAASWHARPLVAELERRGHRVVAPDLPVDRADATFSDYAAVVDEALGDAGDVVLLAKSMGGCSAPLVAARRPVRELVFVAALIPQPGRPLVEVLREEPMVVPGAMDSVAPPVDGLQPWTDEAAARERMWSDCDEATAREAFRHLRPQAVRPFFEPFPLDALPAVPTRYVVCRGDRMVSPEWGREAAPRLLGVAAEELDGDHSPGLTRPAELADLLGA